MNHFSIKNSCHIRIAAAVFATVFVSCTSAPKVTRVEQQADLSGYWDDNDVQQVCDKLIESCLESNNVDRFVNLYAQSHKGESPAAIVLPFRNASSEHIDMQIVSNNMRASIIGSGKLDFVEGGNAREAIRAERADQSNNNASEETAAAMGNEIGAALAFNGEVRSIIDSAGNVSTRTYYVKATLTNIETTRILWEGTETVRKNIKRSAFKP
ncbi:MAG: penicillin-binding protein activator LpoB [Spirochaetaceae bacterium]|jgi:PBP1b-binding outer membrane lipoprotein LpoB|nr:penicillin-binding protein activator LpoB [Spirochaetaceae bacterium]